MTPSRTESGARAALRAAALLFCAGGAFVGLSGCDTPSAPSLPPPPPPPPTPTRLAGDYRTSARCGPAVFTVEGPRRLELRFGGYLQEVRSVVDVSVESPHSEAMILDFREWYDVTDWRVRSNGGRVRHDFRVYWDPSDSDRLSRASPPGVWPMTILACPDADGGPILACSESSCDVYGSEDAVPQVVPADTQVLFRSPWGYGEVRELQEGRTEVFPGNTADPSTVATQVEKIRHRFRIEQVALVGDRGMVTTARIREDLQPASLDWISALTTKGIRKLLKAPKQAQAPPLRPGELLPDTVAEIQSPDFPGERLLVCLNPRLREERARKREDLLRTTEHLLENIAAAIRHSRLRGRDNINRRVGRDANRKKVEKHFDITATDDELSWTRRHERIAAEAQLDGIYVVRTSLASEAIGSEAAVEAYKSLSRVEQSFRSIKDLFEVRPVFVYTPDHVRAHVFLCMLAHYVQWHMRQRLAPLLFEDDDRPAARAARNSPVEPARVSPRAKAKADTRRTPDGFPVHSFPTLLADLATLTLNEVTLPGSPDASFPMLARPTPLQQRAFNLLDIEPHKFVASNLTA